LKALTKILPLCGLEACKNLSDGSYFFIFLLTGIYLLLPVLSYSPNASLFSILSFLIGQYSSVATFGWLPMDAGRNLPELLGSKVPPF
jgi:hypothetical protein